MASDPGEYRHRSPWRNTGHGLSEGQTRRHSPTVLFGAQHLQGRLHPLPLHLACFRAYASTRLLPDAPQGSILSSWLAITQVGLAPTRLRGIAEPHWPRNALSVRAHLQGRDDALVQVAPMLAMSPDWLTYLREPTEAAFADALHVGTSGTSLAFCLHRCAKQPQSPNLSALARLHEGPLRDPSVSMPGRLSGVVPRTHLAASPSQVRRTHRGAAPPKRLAASAALACDADDVEGSVAPRRPGEPLGNQAEQGAGEQA
jgi:hypothetical protein